MLGCVRCSQPQGFLVLGIGFLLDGSPMPHTESLESLLLRMHTWIPHVAVPCAPKTRHVRSAGSGGASRWSELQWTLLKMGHTVGFLRGDVGMWRWLRGPEGFSLLERLTQLLRACFPRGDERCSEWGLRKPPSASIGEQTSEDRCLETKAKVPIRVKGLSSVSWDIRLHVCAEVAAQLGSDRPCLSRTVSAIELPPGTLRFLLIPRLVANGTGTDSMEWAGTILRCGSRGPWLGARAVGTESGNPKLAWVISRRYDRRNPQTVKGAPRDRKKGLV